MVYRASRPREAKKVRFSRISTLADKLRRHKNKERIWRRAIKRLGLVPATVSLVSAQVEP